MTPELLKGAMEPDFGERLIESVREMDAIVRGVARPSRAWGTDEQGCIRDLPELMPPNCS